MKNGRRRRTRAIVCGATALLLATPSAVLAAESPMGGQATAVSASDTASAGSTSSSPGTASATPIAVAGQSAGGATQEAPGETAGSLITVGKAQTGLVSVAPYDASVNPDGSSSAGAAALTIMARAIGTEADVLDSSSQTSASGQTQNSSDVASAKLGVLGWIRLFHTSSDGDSYVVMAGGKRYLVNSAQTCGVDLKGHAGVACATQVPAASSPALGGGSTSTPATPTGGVGGAVASAIETVADQAPANLDGGYQVGVVAGHRQPKAAAFLGSVAHKLAPFAPVAGLSLAAGAGHGATQVLVLLALGALIGVAVAGRKAWAGDRA